MTKATIKFISCITLINTKRWYSDMLSILEEAQNPVHSTGSPHLLYISSEGVFLTISNPYVPQALLLLPKNVSFPIQQTTYWLQCRDNYDSL